MNTTNKVLECVPNFSEGRNEQTINAIAESIKSVEGAHLLHVDISPAANRTVMSFAGVPEAVTEAAFRAVKTAGLLIDMQTQEGVHPRIGATDVCPFVPLYNMTIEEADSYAQALGEKVGSELGIPVYMYEYSAKADYRRALPDIRKGQYQGLAEKMKLKEWQPDYGSSFKPETGATVIGVRDLLVAFNIALSTKDVSKAEFIAGRIRERGYMTTLEGKKKRVNGLLEKVRAIGWYMADYECAQVSFNLLDYRLSSPLKVWEACSLLASEIGISVVGSEVIGLIPERCLLEAGSLVCMERGEIIPGDKQLLIHYAIELLGLDQLKPFNEQEKVLEYALAHAGIIS